MDTLSELLQRFGPVNELEYGADFLEHLRVRGTYPKHQVTVPEIDEVFTHEPQYFLNNSTGRAPLVMVGPTAVGRFLTVALVPSDQRGRWRVYTAFESNRHHINRYRGKEE
ncbi:MAG: hypothetical protein M1298_05325 [Chloroflexi bacterium]|nr:hypothetical protein [Chloroflexota bacterium]